MNEPTRYQLMILRALQGRAMYLGTVSAAEKAKRRAVGKRQRAGRRATRPTN